MLQPKAAVLAYRHLGTRKFQMMGMLDQAAVVGAICPMAQKHLKLDFVLMEFQ